MTKQEVRSLIYNLLPKYDQTNKYHFLVLDAVIEKVLAQWYNYAFVLDPLSLQRYCKRYGGTFTIPVSLDVGANLYYTTYPEKIIPFADKASGVRRVTTKTQSGIKFYPLDQREVELIDNGSYFENVNSKIGYIVTQDRIEYYGMTAVIAGEGVRLDLIVPFSAYADTDNVLIPEITDPQGATFAEAVLKILGVIQPPDSIDDNTDKTPTKEQK
jgi:hypothetical protein